MSGEELLADCDSVWSQILASLANVRSIFAGNDPVTQGLQTFTLRLISRAAEEIGWAYPKDELYLLGQLRALLIKAAGGAGHQKWVPNTVIQ